MTASHEHCGTEDLIADLAQRVDRAIDDCCSNALGGPEPLRQAMRYSLQAGGKRIRPVLAILACRACGGQLDRAIVPALAIEMVHTFSLIHDDLPAMDDDDLRRGKPTSHKVFGEAMAILAGDALLIFAFDLLARQDRPAELATRMVAELAQAAGPAGLTGGQVLDIKYDTDNTDPQACEEIHLLKTAAMIRCAVRLGALAGGGDERQLELLSEYGLKLGLMFQITDDLLDQVGKGADAGRPNLAALVGIETARTRAETLAGEAIAALEPLGRLGEALRELTQLVLNRKE